jgi:stage IV sporulation protein FB
MFGMAGETPFDLRFNLFGIPIRIHPIFWLSAAMMRWNPDRLEIVVLAVICVLVSVLVHELGHALVLRHYGYPSEIVLYFLGGYATATRLPTWKQIWSLAAGPLAGFSLAALVFAVRHIPGADGVFESYPAVAEVYLMLMFSGMIVNVMNLVPCLPLDGGQIMAALVSHYGTRGRSANLTILKISIAAGAATTLWCLWCMQQDRPVIPPQIFLSLPMENAKELIWLQPMPQFLALFFGIMTAQNVMQFNQYHGLR